MNRTIALPLMLCALLGGCFGSGGARPEPIIRTVEVPVPVSVACVPETLGPAPEYPDTDEALRSADPARRYQLVIAGRELRSARLGEIEPVLSSCRGGAE